MITNITPTPAIEPKPLRFYNSEFSLGGLEFTVVAFQTTVSRVTLKISASGKPYRVFRGLVDLNNESDVWFLAGIIAERLRTEADLVLDALNALRQTLNSSLKQSA